ncbi:MAG: endonuclease/exonuclease/phosphatase family protein [Mariniphaga sp.]
MRFFLKWAEKNEKVRDFFSKFGFALNIGATVLLLVACLAPFVSPDLFWPISFFGLAYPYLLLINFIFGLIWLLQRSKKILLPLAAFLTGFLNFTNTFQLLPVSESKQAGVKVLSYNVNYYGYDFRAHNRNAPKILEYLKSEGAEIICIQEATLNNSGKLSPQAIKEALPEINHFQLATTSNYGGSITFSKYPIINMGEIRFPGTSNLVIFSDLKINSHLIIRVYNCHFQSYSIDPEDHAALDSLGSGSNGKQLIEARKISYKLKNGFQLRAIQARTVAAHIKKSPYPVIVCGDFNDTPVSYTYRKVRGELKDAFVTSGWGISNTYNGELPSFRIDYILFNQKWVGENYKRDRVPYSDHFPVHSEIRIE